MQTVWITGGARGIGAAAVRAFAMAGWRVAFTYRAAREAAEMLLSELKAYPVLALQGNMASRTEVARCHTEIRETFGEPDALVANAGVSQQKMFCDLTDEDWDEMFDGNVKTVFYPAQAVLSGMVRRKQGAIVTLSSVWGVTGASCESAYAASKAAVIGLTKSLAWELGPSQIRVNCIAPGVINTDMNRTHSPDTLQALAGETALSRLGTPEEVAAAILFLCQANASFITGQVLGVTGGFMI